MRRYFIQSGENKKYPYTIETWTLSDPDIPAWITDTCKIKGVSMDGVPVLDIRSTNTGGYELLNSDGSGTKVVSTKGKEDFICYGKNQLFSLTPLQMNLLYREIIN